MTADFNHIFFSITFRRTHDSQQNFIGQKKVILIFGAAQDKDIRGMLNQLKKISKQIYLTRMSHPRSFEFTREGEGPIMPDVASAVKAALIRAGKNDVILATGSLYLISEVRKLCIK